MSKTKKTGILSATILLIVLLSSFTLAFGVAIPYWDSPEWYPLKLAPGESKIVQLTLQNTGTEDMSVKAILTGNGVAELYDKNDEYLVSSGETNRTVNIKVEIPKDAKVGEKYKVYSSFQQISTGEGGMVEMTGAFTVNFPVEVVGEKESVLYEAKSQRSKFPWVLAGIILVGIIVLVIASSRKRTP